MMHMKINPETPQAKHEFLKTALRLHGTSMAEVARQLGVTHTTVSLVSKGKNRSRRVEMALASSIGTTPEVLFPDRYVN